MHPMILKTMATDSMPPSLSDAQYFAETAAVLACVESHVDRWLQADVIDIDSARTGGMLELSFPDRSKIIINTQPPLHELWLAARSGGFHFKFVDGRWTDTRSGVDLFSVLSTCASEQGQRALVFMSSAA